MKSTNTKLQISFKILMVWNFVYKLRLLFKHMNAHLIL